MAENIFTTSAAVPRRANLHFDDIPTNVGGTAELPPGYGGLSWTAGIYVSNPAKEFPVHAHNGYFPGTTSGDQVLYANGGSVAFATYNGQGTLTFKSINLTAAFDKSMVLDVYGYHNNVAIYHDTITLGDRHHTHFAPDWAGVDYVLFHVGAEVHDPKAAFSGSYYVMDDLVVGAIDRTAASPTSTDHALAAGAFADHHPALAAEMGSQGHGWLGGFEHIVLA